MKLRKQLLLTQMGNAVADKQRAVAHMNHDTSRAGSWSFDWDMPFNEADDRFKKAEALYLEAIFPGCGGFSPEFKALAKLCSAISKLTHGGNPLRSLDSNLEAAMAEAEAVIGKDATGSDMLPEKIGALDSR